jgi:hypothetical protein
LGDLDRSDLEKFWIWACCNYPELVNPVNPHNGLIPDRALEGSSLLDGGEETDKVLYWSAVVAIHAKNLGKGHRKDILRAALLRAYLWQDEENRDKLRDIPSPWLLNTKGLTPSIVLDLYQARDIVNPGLCHSIVAQGNVDQELTTKKIKEGVWKWGWSQYPLHVCHPEIGYLYLDRSYLLANHAQTSQVQLTDGSHMAKYLEVARRTGEDRYDFRVALMKDYLLATGQPETTGIPEWVAKGIRDFLSQ